MSTLLLLHTESDGSLSRLSLETLSAAIALGEFSVGIVGQTVQSAADAIASCGARAFLAVEGDAFAPARYSTDAAAAEAICRACVAQRVLAPASSRWMRALPGVAQRLGAKVDAHVASVKGNQIRRWFYRNRMEGVYERPAEPLFILLDSGAAPAWSGQSGIARVERLVVEPPTRTTVLRVQAAQTGECTIRPDAELLVVAGAGWTKKQKDGQSHSSEASGLLLDLLSLTQASLGSSKSLVDIGTDGDAVLPFLTHVHQVGQTGSSPRHAKGLATCCHGEEPHVVGWRFINERRAINLDANCGWARKKADVLYVADAFEVLREMRKLLGASTAHG